MGSEKKLALDLPWRFVQPNMQYQYTIQCFCRQVGVAYGGFIMIMKFFPVYTVQLSLSLISLETGL
jgi:hypothetical protein